MDDRDLEVLLAERLCEALETIGENLIRIADVLEAAEDVQTVRDDVLP